MFIETRDLSTRTKAKTLETHPEWYVDEDPDLDADPVPPSPEAWSILNNQMATLIEAVWELTAVTAAKGTGKSAPKVPHVTRPTSGIAALQKQHTQMAENRSAFRQMLDVALAVGEVDTDDEPPEVPAPTPEEA